jgi:hypothetical protein
MIAAEPSSLAVFFVGVIAVAILVYVILDGKFTKMTDTCRLTNSAASADNRSLRPSVHTTFHDAMGRVTGTARTDSNVTTTFHDASGRTTGSIRR